MAQATPAWVEKAEIKDLQRLPIPPLHHTLHRFIEYVEPLVTPNELRETVHEVTHFAHRDGPVLDAQLRDLMKQSTTSWLEGLWDTAYLEYRERTPINVNPAFLLNNEPGASQIDRASRLLEGTARFTVSLRNGTLAPDREGPNPLCMHQYTKLLGATRIPISGRDILVQNHHSRHIVVLSKRQYYVMDILNSNGEAIPSSMIETQLSKILEDSTNTTGPNGSSSPNISILTSEHRDVWAGLYPRLESMNSENLKLINDSILMLVLDDQSPESVDQAGTMTLHNYGESRWFDKSLQLVVYKNGVAGVNMEHAGFDGQTLIRWFGDIHDLSLKIKAEPKAAQESAQPHQLKKLSWVVDETILAAIQKATTEFVSFCKTMDLKVLSFSKFGKKAITKHKISPDAFVQLAFHLAYFRTFGTSRSAYESCSMKRFYHGRTECLRSLTSQVADFVGLTRCPPSTAEQQIAAARQAFDAHVTRAKACQQGNGVDRHLWGMYQLALHQRQKLPGFEIPKLYSLPAWKRMRHDHLSTSNCGHDSLSFFGFGPTWGDGLGIGYIIKANQIIAAVSSFEQTAPKFVDQLERCLTELLDLFEHGKPLRTMQAKL